MRKKVNVYDTIVMENKKRKYGNRRNLYKISI